MDKKKLAASILLALITSIAFGLFLTILIIWKVGIGGVLDAFRHAGWFVILAYLTVSVLIAIGVALKWHVVLDAYGVRMPFYTLFTYRLIGFAVSYMTPTAHVGGEPVRALLLHRDGIPMKVSFTSAIVDRSLEVLFNIAMFFLGALIILNLADFPKAARITIFALSILSIIAAVLFVKGMLSKKHYFHPFLKLFRLHKRKSWRVIKAWTDDVELLIGHFYAKKKKHFRLAVLINALLWILMMLEYTFALRILGYEPSILGAFLFLTGVALAYSIPIPAGLGVLEIGQISAGALLGIPATVAVALALIIRLRDLLWTLLGLALLGLLHLNVLNLFTKSQEAAREFKFETISLELDE